jgi:large subunit ribosomal protein L9
MMNVILLQRVDKLGQMGDVVTVKPGYARNFLLPQGIALRATDENKAVFEAKRAQLEADNLKRREEAEDMAGRMEGLSIPMIRQASDTGQLYGSVTTRDIASGISEAGFTIGSNQVLLDRAIKTLGVHDIRVKLHPEVDLMVKINVAKSEEEALGLIVEEEEDDFGNDLEFGAFDNEDGDVVITRSDDDAPAADEADAEAAADDAADAAEASEDD